MKKVLFLLVALLLVGTMTTYAQSMLSAAGKFTVLDFTLDITKSNTFWAGLIGMSVWCRSRKSLRRAC